MMPPSAPGRYRRLLPVGALLLALAVHACTHRPPAPGPEGTPSTADVPSRYDTQDTAVVDFTPQPPVLAVSPEEQQGRFVMQPGYRMDPVLTDPVIAEPMQIAFDGNGRLFVLEMRSYMQDLDATGELLPTSRISMHEDTNNDGIYDRHTIFVDSLVVPRFVMPFGVNSILTMESNEDEIWLYTDETGNGVADRRELFTTHFGRAANIEHQQASLTWAMDNWLYSTYNAYRIRWTPDGVIREATSSPGGAWGVTQDDYGKTYVQEGHTGLPAYFQFPIRYGNFQWSERFAPGLEVPYPLAGLADYQPGARASRPDGTLNRVTGSAGNDVVRGHRLPADLLGDYIYGEPVGRIVRRLRMLDVEGLMRFENVYQAQQEEFIRSTDHLFRPVQMQTAPDGTLYISDTYRGIIQQGNWTQEGSYLRQKIAQYQLDQVYGLGRIWRLSHEDIERDTVKPRMNDETPAQLVHHLEHPNGWWRDTAQRLLVLHQDRSVVPALEDLVRNSDNLYTRFHALWTLEGLYALDPDLVRLQLTDPAPEMRIQALRVSESLYKGGDQSFAEDYRRMVHDPDGDVVIQALLTLHYFQPPDLEDVARDVVASRDALGIQFVGERIIEQLESPPTPSLGGLTEDERERMLSGMEIYQAECASCHGRNGTGIRASGTVIGPSLAGLQGVLGHRDFLIKTLLHGLEGMETPKSPMGTESDEWVAAVASYVRNSFANEAPHVQPEQVARIRGAYAERAEPWAYDELEATLPAPLDPQPEWRVTASHSAPVVVGATADPARVFGFEGWTTGESQAPGMWFQVEFPEPVTLTEIEFTSPTQGGGGMAPRRTSPRGYLVELSLDGTTWTSVAEGEGAEGAVTSILFQPTQARFARITQTAQDEEAPRWTMRRLVLYEAGRDAAP